MQKQNDTGEACTKGPVGLSFGRLRYRVSYAPEMGYCSKTVMLMRGQSRISFAARMHEVEDVIFYLHTMRCSAKHVRGDIGLYSPYSFSSISSSHLIFACDR